MKRHNKTLFMCLLIIAVTIWSYNFIQIFSVFSEKKHSILASEELNIDIYKQFNYKADFKDPFFCKAFMIEDEKQEINKGYGLKNNKNEIKTKVKLPSCKITGIVYNDQKPMAMIEHNGSTIIVKEGDIVDSMRIKKIFIDSVKIIYKGKTFYIKK